MKKLIALTIALFVLAAGNVFGQALTDNATFNANATIIATGVTIAEEAPLNFGAVLTNTNPVVALGDEGNQGELSITGQESTVVYISVPSTISLGNGTDNLEVGSITLGTGTAATPAAYNNEEAVTLDGTGNLSLFVAGTLQAVGGGVIPTSHSAGDYTGNATIQVSYNTF